MRTTLIAVAIMSLVVAVVFFISYILMLLWNWIMPYLFGLPTISFWMSVGILFLVGILTNSNRFFSKCNS